MAENNFRSVMEGNSSGGNYPPGKSRGGKFSWREIKKGGDSPPGKLEVAGNLIRAGTTLNQLIPRENPAHNLQLNSPNAKLKLGNFFLVVAPEQFQSSIYCLIPCAVQTQNLFIYCPGLSPDCAMYRCQKVQKQMALCPLCNPQQFGIQNL